MHPAKTWTYLIDHHQPIEVSGQYWVIKIEENRYRIVWTFPSDAEAIRNYEEWKREADSKTVAADS
jgi:hypothetical protein